ncbi:MAG: hypothetical protein IJA94_05965 [Bacilli bacterium]|nr:hypothetical protein [Bacilli bacterium]
MSDTNLLDKRKRIFLIFLEAFYSSIIFGISIVIITLISNVYLGNLYLKRILIITLILLVFIFELRLLLLFNKRAYNLKKINKFYKGLKYFFIITSILFFVLIFLLPMIVGLEKNVGDMFHVKYIKLYGIEALKERLSSFYILMTLILLPLLISLIIFYVIINVMIKKIEKEKNDDNYNVEEESIEILNLDEIKKKTTKIVNSKATKIIKKIIKFIIIILLILVILTLLLNVILNIPSRYEECYEECYDGDTSSFCLDKFKHTFYIPVGSGEPGTSGFYFYNPITKTIHGIIEKDDDVPIFSISKKKYKVIFHDDNFFVFRTESGYSDTLIRDDCKIIKSNEPISGLYESFDNSLSLYILENDQYVIYNSKTKVSSYLNIEELVDNNYFIDVNNKIVYKLSEDETVELSYKNKNIPSYYNMDSLEMYENNKKNSNGHFIAEIETNSVKEVWITNGNVEKIYNTFIDESPLEVLKWDEKYVYFTEMSKYNLRYNVLENKYEIDEYIEYEKEELEISANENMFE